MMRTRFFREGGEDAENSMEGPVPAASVSSMFDGPSSVLTTPSARSNAAS